MTGLSPDVTTPTGWAVVRLVAEREVRTRLASKAWWVTTLVMVVIALAISVVAKLAAGAGTLDVGVTSATDPLAAPMVAVGKTLGTDIRTHDVSSESTGRSQVRAGDLDALLVGDGSSVTVVVKQDLDTGLKDVLNVLARQLTTSQQVVSLGGDPAEFDRRIAGAKAEVEPLTPPKTYDSSRLVLGVVAGILIYIALLGNGQAVAQGVVEEKSTRVVELLLATIRPWQLMSGKVLGIGLLGLAQVAIIAGAGLVSATALGTLDLSVSATVGTFVWLAVWFLLGFFAYALALAAVAALVSRQEDVASVMMPVLSLLIIGYVIGISVLPSDPGNTWCRVLSMIPVFAPTMMPIRLVMGSVPVLDIVVSLTLMVATIPFLVWLAGRIYRNAVMRTGARVRLRDALRSA